MKRTPYKFNFISSLYYLTFFSIMFRNTISTTLGGAVGSFSLALLFLNVPLLVYVAGRRSVNWIDVLFFFYIFYLTFLVLVFELTASFGSGFTALIGFSNLACIFLFWFVYFNFYSSERNAEKVIMLFVTVGFINAIGAAIQFYISPSLFGLISNGVYADSEVLENVNVTRRAISFIASPQSLSLYLAFSLCLSTGCKLGAWKGGVVRSVLLFAGFLTVSKAFFVFVFVFVLFNYLTVRYIGFLILLLLAFFIGVYSFQEHLARVVQIVYFLNNIDDYSAYRIWEDSLNYALSFPGLFIGHGIGVFSRGAQQIGGYVILHGSTESFFLQLLVETGLLGTSIFIMLMLISAFRLYFMNRVVFSCLIGFSAISIFTPAVYGFSTGLGFYFCIVWGLLGRKGLKVIRPIRVSL
ncbi:hypothetical protein [Agarivorans sp. DSG3-1]|uniref:hypothetical protein n=1 Tax=Agarivorans sp. DSG3-1 TaxID=3342249 RepID=UPI00398E3C23